MPMLLCRDGIGADLLTRMVRLPPNKPRKQTKGTDQMQLLQKHTSPDTAYVVDDYPYGFRLRCKIRYWIEYKKGHGFRIVSQTSNPKRPGLVWNKPKAGTYARFGAALYLDDQGHVQGACLGEYSSGKEASDWRGKYGEGVPQEHRHVLNEWVAAKLAYDAARNPGDPLDVGMLEARKAWLDEAVKSVGESQ